MNKQFSLKIILILSIGGMLFSGYLSYYELFAGGCSQAIISCGTKGFTIADLPACVYGFLMYLIVFIITLFGLKSKK